MARSKRSALLLINACTARSHQRTTAVRSTGSVVTVRRPVPSCTMSRRSFDLRQQQPAARHDVLRHAAPPLRAEPVVLDDDMREAEDRRQRRAQLVGDGRQEVVLPACFRFETIRARLELMLPVQSRDRPANLRGGLFERRQRRFVQRCGGAT